MITSWNRIRRSTTHWYGPFAVWKGGLGVWGGILFGVLAGAVDRAPLRQQRPPLHGRRRAGAPARPGDRPLGQLVEPGALRQAHDAARGRLEIHGKGAANTYHPTFLYEFIWDILGVLVLLWIDRRFTLRRPALFALYVAWYTAFRTFEETLRIDPSNHFLGPARQLLGLARRASSRASRSSSGGSSCAKPSARRPRRRSPASAREVPKGPNDGRPAWPRPVARVRFGP